MSALTDPFDEMPLGPGNPPGWIGTGTVYPYTSGGLWPGHNWYSTTGTLQTPFLTSLQYFDLYFGFYIASAIAGVPLLGILSQSIYGGYDNILSINLEVDNSISDYTQMSGGSGFIDNSGNYIDYGLNFFEWYYAIVSVTITPIVNGSLQTLRFAVNMSIDGNMVLSKALTSNYIQATELLNGPLLCGMNALLWTPQGLLGGSLGLSQIYINSAPSGPDSLVRSAQLPMEPAIYRIDENIRSSQLPVEVSKLPKNGNVRSNQLPIEVATQGGGGQQTNGWIVYEA